MIIDIGPTFYSGPSPNNNDNSFYKQIDQFVYLSLYFVRRKMLVKISYRTIPTTERCQFLKVSLFVNRLSYLNYFYYVWYDKRYWSKFLFMTIASPKWCYLGSRSCSWNILFNFYLKGFLVSMLANRLINFNYIRYDHRYWSQILHRTIPKQ